jgi:hypothetical protein
MPAPRPHPPLPAPRVPLSRDIGSPVVNATAIDVLRADLHELAADFHELAAAIHDLRAEEHAQALRDSLGDPIDHQLQADLRRTAAAAERASAQKERALSRSVLRLSAMRLSKTAVTPDADWHRRSKGRVDVAAAGDRPRPRRPES